MELDLYKLQPGDALEDTREPINQNFQKIKEAIGQTGKGVYGGMFDITARTPDLVRIGDMDAHRELPLQKAMRRCLQADDLTVNYYCDPNNSNLREDGTPANLDGTDGQFMLEIPALYYRFRLEGNWYSALFSKHAFEGATFQDKMYISVAEAGIDRQEDKLVSLINDDPRYRGGNNQSDWDGQGVTSQLGKPVTATSMDSFNQLAANRGEGWFAGQYEHAKIISWLMTIEYATHFHQRDFNSQLDANGFKQGGLGPGMTDLDATEWTNFNGYYPLVKVGLTTDLGNQTGIVPVTLPDFPTAGESRNTQVFSYRGIENFWGNIWEYTDGVRFEIENDRGKIYLATRRGVANNDRMGYKYLGQLPASSGYISEMWLGEDGHLIPKATSGASATTNYTDYFWNGSDGMRVLRRGGNASGGSTAGSAAAAVSGSSSGTAAYIGSRLCNFGGA